MQKTLKRTLSLVLTVLMVTALFTVAPLSVGAAETDAEAVGAEPVIVPGQTVNAEITTDGEIAYIKFVPTKDMKIIVYSSSNEDTYGYFYDSQKNELDYNDDGGDNSNFKLTENVTANTTYYIGAKFYSDSETGTIPVTLIEDKPKTVRFYDDEKLLGSIPYDDTFSYSYTTLYNSDYPALFLADTDEQKFKGYQTSSGTICYSKSSDSLSYQWNISTSDFDADGYLNLYSSWAEAYTINFYNGEAFVGSAKVESSQIADSFSVDDSLVLENANGKVFKGYKKAEEEDVCISLSYGSSLSCSYGALSTEDFDANKTLNVYAVWEDGYTLSFYNGETFLCDYIVESPDSIGWSIDYNSYSPASTDSAFLSDGDGKVFKGYKKSGSDTLCYSIFRGAWSTRLDYTSNSITAADFDANRTLRLDAEWVDGYTVEFYNGETKVDEHIFESIDTIGDISKTNENENIFLSNGNGFIFTGYENNGITCFELSSNYGVSNLAYQSGTITETDFTDRTMRVTATFNTNVCKFTAYSLSIEGDTSLIFMVDTSKTTATYLYPNVSVPYGRTEDGDYDYHYRQLDDNTMKIQVELSAKMMSADINITMPDKSSCTYSIRQYAENILSGNYDDYLSQTYGYSSEKIAALKSLLKSMLNFGAKAQVQFDCATDDLANKNLEQYNGGVEYTAPVVNPANLTSLSYTDSQFDNVGLVYAGSSLGLFDKFGYCVVFEDTKGPCLDNSEGEGREFGEAQQSFPSFSLPDEFKDTWEGLESAQYLTTDGISNIYYVMDPNAANYGNYYLYFKTKAIYPQNFDEDVVINISRTAKNDAVYTNSITINPVTYIKRALETTDTTTRAGRTLVDTVTAVYDYCTNAKAYFAM